MSKTITITDKQKELARQALEKYLANPKSDTFSIKPKRGKKNAKTKLIFSETAWEKMTALVDHFETEVAWHGVVEKQDDGYRIEDILVYPQTVGQATVNVEDEYGIWLATHPEFKRIRMQGHSHVKMNTTPSQTDRDSYDKIIDQLEDFYIFMITNKNRSMFIEIYDIDDNMIYETSDVDVEVEQSEDGLISFIDKASELVKTYTPQVWTSSKYNHYDSELNYLSTLNEMYGSDY